MSVSPNGMEIGDYVIDTSIGVGATASVFSALHVPTQETVAVKIVAKASLTGQREPVLWKQEIEVMKESDHPFIARFFDLFEDDKNYYLVQEFGSYGNLLDWINDKHRVSEPECRRIFGQLLSAIEYLHKTLSIVHRDLKAENVMIDDHNNVRIIDFGLCHRHVPGQRLMTPCGSPAYVAPEVLERKAYSDAADIWSLGVILYALGNSELPFDDENIRVVCKAIISEEPEYPGEMSIIMTDFVKRMLTKDPDSRSTVDDLKGHPWIRGALIDEQVRAWQNDEEMSEARIRAEVRKVMANSKKPVQSENAVYEIIRRRKLVAVMNRPKVRNMGWNTMPRSSDDAFVLARPTGMFDDVPLVKPGFERRATHAPVVGPVLPAPVLPCVECRSMKQSHLPAPGLPRRQGPGHLPRPGRLLHIPIRGSSCD